jgi:hypothetical protein
MEPIAFATLAVCFGLGVVTRDVFVAVFLSGPVLLATLCVVAVASGIGEAFAHAASVFLASQIGFILAFVSRLTPAVASILVARVVRG